MLHHKNGINVNISHPVYPQGYHRSARSGPYPHQMVDLLLDTTSMQPWMSAEILSTRQSAVKVLSKWQASAQILTRDHKKQTGPLHRPYGQLQLPDESNIQAKRTDEYLNVTYPKLMEFVFTAIVASSWFSWGYFKFNNIIDLTALTLFFFFLLRNKSKYKIQYIIGMLHMTDITYIETKTKLKKTNKN